MRLYAVLPAVIALLQREGRVTYRALQRDFGFDVSFLDDVRHELVFKRLAMDEQGQGLVWTGGVYAPMPLSVSPHTTPSVPEPPAQISPAVSALPPMELGSDPSPAASSTASDAVAMPPQVVPTEVTSPEQTATPPTPMALDGPAPGASSSITTEVESTLADATAATSTRSAPEAERRQLTVMFCDLVGSTDLSGKLDPEDLRDVVRAYQETAADVIQRYEGHIAQYLGDGLLIYFGWPHAHENDAERALYSGLEIPVAMATLNTRLHTAHGVELAVRIGIHTGPVVVGEMGGGGRHENLALGETPNIAARLEGLAQPNSAVISQMTAQLVQRSFVLEEVGLHELKGVADPMMLYTVVSPRETAHDDHEALLAGGFDALVGRDEEIGLLLRRWEQSKEGLGQVVLLSGEAGIGKSSLVEGLRDHVRQAGFTRIAFRCSPYHTHSAFYPIIEQVHRALGWQPEDPVDTRLAKLEQALEGTSLPLEEAVPVLAVLLSLPLPEGRYAALTLSPQQQRQQTQDMLVAWLLEEAERQAVLAVWEDLHWADPSTLETLGLLVDQAPTVTMLHVLTFRPEFEPPWPSRSHLTPITLNRLERPQVEALVRRLAGGKRLPEEVVAHIVGKTDGVPLYVEELTKMLLTSDLLREDAEQYVLTGPLLSVAIPDTLQDSLMARLDQMNTAKEVAQLGSVLGREFRYDMLQALAWQDEETLQSALAQLVAAELLYQRGRPPRARYIFKHALIQDTAYASLLRSTRRQVHQQVAQLLEARFAEVVETQPELVAQHYTEAVCPDQAIAYWQRAGQHAVQRSANQEAVSHLTTGLELLAALPDTPERIEQDLALHMALGPVLMATRGQAAAEVEQAYSRAWERCQQLGETPQLFPALRGLWRFYHTAGRLATAREVGEQLLSLAQRQHDATRRMAAHTSLGVTLSYMGAFTAARTHLEQGIALSDPAEQRTLALRYGQAPGVQCLVYAAIALWCLGTPDQSLQRSQAACALARELEHPLSLAMALNFTARSHLLRGEVHEAREQAESLIALSTDHALLATLSQGRFTLGGALAAQGQGEEGVTLMRQGLTDTLATGNRVTPPVFLPVLAEACGTLGQVDAGLTMVAEALELVEQTGVRYYEAETYRIKGTLLLQQADPDAAQAEACFQQALDIARQQEAKSLELRAATSLARLWQQQDKCQEAYDLLAPVYGWFTEGFDTADLQEAKALVEELS